MLIAVLGHASGMQATQCTGRYTQLAALTLLPSMDLSVKLFWRGCPHVLLGS
jgi:hypothetical protein